MLQDDFPTTLSATQEVQFVPQSRTFHLWNLSAQDSFSLTDRLKLIAGIKIAKEPYTGVAAMPNIRLSWAVEQRSDTLVDVAA